MVRITGIIPELKNINHCYLRVRASAPWIGVGTNVRVFEVSKGTLDIELNSSPKDRVWQISVTETKDAPFIPTESWIVPVEDCQIQDIRNFSLDYLKRLESENDSLKRELAVKNRQLDIANSVSTILLNDYVEITQDNLAEIAANNIEKLS